MLACPSEQQAGCRRLSTDEQAVGVWVGRGFVAALENSCRLRRPAKKAEMCLKKDGGRDGSSKWTGDSGSKWKTDAVSFWERARAGARQQLSITLSNLGAKTRLD